jgi:hypothetical protein
LRLAAAFRKRKQMYGVYVGKLRRTAAVTVFARAIKIDCPESSVALARSTSVAVVPIAKRGKVMKEFSR